MSHWRDDQTAPHPRPHTGQSQRIRPSLKYDGTFGWNAVFFLFILCSSNRSNTTVTPHQATKQLTKGEVMLFFLCTRPCLVFDTVQSMGHWKHKILTHHRKCSEGKAMLPQSDIDSFWYKDSWWGGCHPYHQLFLVSILSCCQSFPPEVLLRFEWIMRCRSEWKALKRTW